MASRDYEAPDFIPMFRRVTRAMVRRAGEGDLEILTALRECQTLLDDALADSVVALRTPRGDGPGLEGYSWTEIGREMGITRQTAQIRFGRNRQGETA